MDFRIRRGEERDARPIGQVQVESWKSTYADIVPDDFLASMDTDSRAERWRELIAAGDMHIFVAEDETGVFGFVSGGKLREPIDGYDTELFAIYLLQKNQGKGVGRRLFGELAATLRSEGRIGMALWVLRQNPAVGFYQRMGGVEIGHKTIQIGGAALEEVAFGFNLSLDPTQPVAVQ
ncbi:MAG: GNAT family N-acetyltransferase [Terracidiphilus sp.]